VPYFFFLSYARGDDDQFVEQFYHDLSGEVRNFAGLSPDEEVGFFDAHSIEWGAPWSTRLVEALSSCRSFLALCSPRYFLSEPCGKEWAFFADRLRHHEQATTQQLSALIPVVWLPSRRMHPLAQAVQYHTEELGDVYRRDGMRQLIRLQRNRDAYLHSISLLARRIVENAETSQMPPSRVKADFHQLHNAFGPEPAVPQSALPDEPRPLPSAPPTSRYVHFIVAAPARHELGAVRRNLRFYGESPLDWSPYLPTLDSPIVDYARTIAAEHSLESDVAGIDRLPELFDKATVGNQIVVMLVDAWATRLNGHRAALAECNSRDAQADEPTTAVMVPSNHADSETREHWRQLSDSLRSILVNRVTSGDDRMFRASILTHTAFDADLRVVLDVAQNRIFVKGTVHQPPPDEPAATRPILNFPDLG
jgi:FxsC-like protein